MLGIAVLLNSVKLTLIGLRDVYGCESVLDLKIFLGSLGDAQWLSVLVLWLYSQVKT